MYKILDYETYFSFIKHCSFNYSVICVFVNSNETGYLIVILLLWISLILSNFDKNKII